MQVLPYPRDLRGHGARPPHARWPGGARIAVQFVLNYEEGGENNPLHGDATSETFLSELVAAQAYENRHMTMESMYEYGSRAGVWRILREFDARGLPLTVFGVVSALQRYPELVQAFLARGDEIANHGLRWIHHQHMPEATERQHIAKATELMRELTGGSEPSGWYTGRDSPHTRRLVAEQGGYAYDSDYYGDDLPFWLQVQTADGAPGAEGAGPVRVPHLVVPYALDTNDMRFVQAQGFNTGEHFFTYLRDAFDALYAEGDPQGLDRPKMMSIGMHCRLLGKPGRIGALQRFLDHVQAHERVWICRRIDIARHWQATHPFDPATAFAWRS
ncbi:MAG: allantoinase PuuE [Leptothrix sp. (in: Bacteria)]|nr:allantoinase PuuE [Leptothrix sp. (in: b-proteobacteria)]